METDPARLLIGYPERDAGVDALRAHLAQGRIGRADFDARRDRVREATTRGELNALFFDLPQPHPDYDEADEPGMIDTPTSNGFVAAAIAMFLLGLPAAITYTALTDRWWPIAVVIALFTLFVAMIGFSQKAPPPAS